MLDTLPNELLVLIFEHFAVTPTQLHGLPQEAFTSTRQAWLSLANLCRTCRCFRTIAEPLLYKNYIKPTAVLSPLGRLRFRGFLRTILKRPELAQHVRALHIGPWPHPGSKERYFRTFGGYDKYLDDVLEVGPPDAELTLLYLSHARKMNVGKDRERDHQHFWSSSLQVGDEEAEITLLLALTTNLERLEIVMPDIDQANARKPARRLLFPHLLTSTAKVRPFQHLRYLSVYKNDLNPVLHFDMIDSHTWGGGYPIAPFLPFLSLPRLEVFVAGNADQTSSYWNSHYPTYEAHSSRLERLSLKQCSLAPAVLEHLVSRCSALKSFECEFAEDVFETEVFSWDKIGNILRHQRHSLQRLTLDCENMSHLTFEDPSDPLRPVGGLVSVGSLRDFTNLTYLNARQVALLGFEVVLQDGVTPARPILPFTKLLPPSLEHLIIENCTLFAIPQLEAVLADLANLFPDLQSVCVEPVDLHLGDPDIPAEEAKERLNRLVQLRSGFQNAGIRWSVGEHDVDTQENIIHLALD